MGYIANNFSSTQEDISDISEFKRACNQLFCRSENYVNLNIFVSKCIRLAKYNFIHWKMIYYCLNMPVVSVNLIYKVNIIINIIKVQNSWGFFIYTKIFQIRLYPKKVQNRGCNSFISKRFDLLIPSPKLVYSLIKRDLFRISRRNTGQYWRIEQLYISNVFEN